MISQNEPNVYYASSVFFMPGLGFTVLFTVSNFVATTTSTLGNSHSMEHL